MKLFFSGVSRKLRFLRFSNKGKYILLFLNGFLLSLLVYFYSEDNYEKQLFHALANNIKAQTDTLGLSNDVRNDSILVKSLRLVYQLESSRAEVFKDYSVNGIKAQVIQPVTYDLMTGKQACGGFSYVLGRLLKELNTNVRFAQMKVDGLFGGHILIEAETPDGWVVLDPLFDISFRKPNGKLASFADVKGDWNYYKQQLPPGYVMDYSYDDVQYTNWDKIPIIMPMLRSALTIAIGKEKAENFSFRTLFLSKFNVLFKITLIIYLFVFYRTVRGFVHQRRKFSRITV